MRNKFLIVLTPLLSVNSLFVFLNGCNSHAPYMDCGYYNSASLLPMNNADSTMRPPTADGVPAKAFVLLLTINDTVYTCRAGSLFPVNAAYAEHFNHVTHTSIDSFTLTSDHDFDATHPAGSDLKSFFSIKAPELLHVGANNFYLFHPPADTGTYTFTIKLFAADSTKNLTAASMPVKLLP